MRRFVSLIAITGLWLLGASWAAAQTATLTTTAATYAAEGGTITLTAVISYSTSPTSLGWEITLPAGWAYVGGTGEPGLKPTAGDTGALTWAYFDGFGASSSSFTCTVSYPAGLQGTQTISADAFYLSPQTALSVAPIALTRAGVVDFSFSTQPGNQTVTAGGTATFTAGLDGTPAPTLQWQVSIDAGATWTDLPGATAATLTIANATLDQTGNRYRLRAVRDAVTKYSDSATLTVTPTAPALHWRTSTSQLSPSGGTITVTVNFDYPTSPVSLGLEATLPTGWSYSGGNSEPGVKPTTGDTGTVEWAYLDGFGATSSSFSFTVQYPAGETGTKALAGLGYYLSPQTALPVAALTFIGATEQFSTWRTSVFTTTELNQPLVSGPNADPDGDGLSNLVEYALGLEPKSANAANAPSASVTTNDWTYTYTRPAERSDLSYAVEVSTNLTNWSSTGVTLERTATGARETWQARYPRTGTTQLFFRLKVTTQ